VPLEIPDKAVIPDRPETPVQPDQLVLSEPRGLLDRWGSLELPERPDYKENREILAQRALPVRKGRPVLRAASARPERRVLAATPELPGLPGRLAIPD